MVLPRVGQSIRLHFTGSSEEEQDLGVYKSRITDMTEELASIELPTSENTGRTGVFRPGTSCLVWYIGEDGSRYEFRSSIVKRESGHLPVLLLPLPKKEEIVRTQRRNYLRIDAALDIAVKHQDPLRRYHFLAKTMDISGGGLSFSCDESYRLREKDVLQVWIALPRKNGNVQQAYAELEIVRQKAPAEKGLHQWISGKFTKISEQDRVKVVRACYERQLELRQKGVED
ncbi:flagellar brake protein [Brevibacillus sp. SAFN-007a]|uniref:flagellar brake protein n=1 Tax=Brevibacillus sp. SAFN-007a TaxID=3436862 RepID=UPI003F7D8F40